jgi:hypothetical protein
MSNIFKQRLFFGVLLLCTVLWLSFLEHPLLDGKFKLVFPLVIALQFFLLGWQYHEEKTEKNNDS